MSQLIHSIILGLISRNIILMIKMLQQKSIYQIRVIIIILVEVGLNSLLVALNWKFVSIKVMIIKDKSNICILLRRKTFLYNNVSAPALIKYCHTLRVYIYYCSIFKHIFSYNVKVGLTLELVVTSLWPHRYTS